MSEKTKRAFQACLALGTLLGAMLACNMPGSEQNEQIPLPGVSGTIQPTVVLEVLFVESDCPTEGFSGLTANAGAGALDCRYHWNGKFGADNLEMTIMQYTDSTQYHQVIDSDLGHRQAEVATIKAPQSSSSSRTNDNVDIIQDDNNDFIYMETYNSSRLDTPDIPLCGNGWGTLGVDGKFEVTLQLTDSCDISTFVTDYSHVMITLRDAALAAISRAEKNIAP